MEKYFKDIEPLKEILKSVLDNIPENCRTNFYRNIDTLKIGKKTLDSTAHYNVLKNIINLDIDNMKKNDTFDQAHEFNIYVLKHELYHAFSSNFDEENKVFYIGFSKNFLDKKKGKESTNYKEINEAFTNFLSVPITDKNSKYMGTMYSFVAQLSFVVDLEIMKDAYFNNRGIEPLKEELMRQENKKEDIDAFFSVLESFNIDANYGHGFPSFIFLQDKLLDFSNNKLKTIDLRSNKVMFLERMKASLPEYNETQRKASKQKIDRKILELHKH